MTDQPVVTTSSDLGRLDFALKDRDEMFVVEHRGGEPRHGIATPDAVTWLPTVKLPGGGVEVGEHVSPARRDQVVADAEAKFSDEDVIRHIFPGEESRPR